MKRDDEWEQFKKSVNKLETDKADLSVQKAQAAEITRDEAFESAPKASSLATQFYNLMRHLSLKGLVSRIYNNTGIGSPPISGGKIEGKKRGKLFE